jgi:uncharacterized protein
VSLLERAEVVLHVGDFTAASVLAELHELAPVEGVHGNMDDAELTATLPERLVVEVGGMRVGLVHDAGPATGRRERLQAWFPSCEVVAYGHTHMPEIACVDAVWTVNPGSPTERRRAPAHTMIVIRDRRPELVQLA